MELNNPFTLKGKKILVTGASSGIGRAIAIACGNMGASVIATGRNHDRLLETLTILGNADCHRTLIADLTIPSDVAKLVEELPKIDGVVFCAGVQERSITRLLVRETLDRVFETNFYSVCNLNASILSHKKLNKGASVVFISSAAANYIAEIGNAAYSASKGALSSYARVLAVELVARKIRVNSILPGMVRTPLLQQFNISSEEFAEDENKYPLGYGEPEDVANAAVFLLSDASKWITGTSLLLDGGLTLH